MNVGKKDLVHKVINSLFPIMYIIILFIIFRFNIFSFYIHRYLRLTPPYAAMILLQASLLIHMGDGPLWNNLVPYYTQFCADYFWSALLYIQTIYNTMEIVRKNNRYFSIISSKLFLVLILTIYLSVLFNPGICKLICRCTFYRL